MRVWLTNLLLLVSIAAVSLTGWAAFEFALYSRHSAAVPNLQPTADRMNTTLDIVNRPCASVDKDGHLLPDGPICELDEAIHDVRKIATSSGKQVAQTDTLIVAAAQTIADAGTAVKGVAGSTTTTLDAATALLGSANDPKVGLPAVLSHTDAAVGKITASLTSQDAANPGTITQFNTFFAANQKDWTLTSYNVEEMTSHGAGIMFDFQNVTDKASADYLRSKTPWGQFRQKLSDSYDIGAMVARHF